MSGVVVVVTGIVVAGLPMPGAEAARPPATITVGPAVVSDTNFTTTAKNYVVVAAGTSLTVRGKLAVGDTGSATDQIQIGWAGSAQPLGCIYNGPGSTHTRFLFTLGAPPTNGASQVIVNFAQGAACSTAGWATSNQAPAVAEVAVIPTNSGASGPISVSNVTVDGAGSNSVTFYRQRRVTVQGLFAVGDTGNAVDQIEVGWEGSPRPSACAYDGRGDSHGRFSVSIGPPPHQGANYVVVDYAQNFSCNLNGWWGGSSEPPQTAVVALAYGYMATQQ